jgi:hypothetical protein
MKAARVALICLALAACAPPAAESPAQRAVALQPLPPMKLFGPTRATPPQRSNPEMARDFIDLSFRLESGRVLDRFTRFERPVTVTMKGAIPPTAPQDLARVTGRLRAEAGLDVTVVPRGPAAITIEFLPRARLQRLVPEAACYVVPNVSSFVEYRSARRSDRVAWRNLTERVQVAIFVPSDTSAQEVRDCLNEELAQALGPLNDLYRLSDSVFNDDNFHGVLTGFDMLMLRAHYAPELANGMTQAEVAARLPAILARLNPAGQRKGPPPAAPTPPEWMAAVQAALGPRGTSATRRAGAQTAVEIAAAEGWTDARTGFSLFALGRLTLADEMDLSLTALSQAAAIYRRLPDAAIHVAHIDMQVAALAMSGGQADAALLLVDRAIPAARAAENAALLASLLLVKAEAMLLLNRLPEAEALRLDSLGWAQYGFGTEAQVRARMSAITILSPGPEGGR